MIIDSPIRYTSPILVQAIQIQHCQRTTFNKNSGICRVIMYQKRSIENTLPSLSTAQCPGYTYISFSVNAVNIHHQWWSGLRLHFESAHGDAVDNQQPILNMSNQEVHNWWITYPFTNTPDKLFIIQQPSVQCLVQGILLPLIVFSILSIRNLDCF